MKRSDAKTLVLLFIIALILRSLRLFDLDVWPDEVVLLFIIDGSLTDIWKSCQLDNFPPLFPWLMKLWSLAFAGENAMRIFTAICGSLTPPAAYLLGKAIDGKKLGYLLGIACLISVPLLHFSQMIRMYTLLPFLTCISLLGFIQGLKTNKWKFWIMVSIANLLGFYMYVFMIFLLFIESVYLLYIIRFDFRKYFRPFLAHLPAIILMLFWITPLLLRFQHLQDVFWVARPSHREVGALWFFLGTGTDFGNHYIIATLLNLPFVLGILLGIKFFWKNQGLWISLVTLIGIVMLVYIISLYGQSFFFKRYFMFLTPVYLCLAIAGWMSVGKTLWRKFGMGATYLILLVSTTYYYCEYYSEFPMAAQFAVSQSPGVEDEGHAISKNAAWIRDSLQNNEIVIHFSDPQERTFSYFPSVYYNKRELPEYIYSADPIPDYIGGQYLQPGEWIRSLADLDSLPQGIWVVSIEIVETLFDSRYFDIKNNRKRGRWRGIDREDLPKELYDNGYAAVDTVRFGAITTLHFRKSS